MNILDYLKYAYVLSEIVKQLKAGVAVEFPVRGVKVGKQVFDLQVSAEPRVK